MTAYEDELAARARRARDVALFRYGVIRAAADPDFSPQQRGALVRALAAGAHKGPDGQVVTVGRSTLDRWIRDWRAGGFDALVPGIRQVAPRTSAGVLELAVALKKEKPQRTAAQVHRILVMRLPAGQVPSVRTIQRHFVRMELTCLDGTAAAPETFGRFEASAPGELWVSDVLHGPAPGGKKTYLFGIEDDHSRFITGHWWTTREDTVGLFAALRRAVEAHGAPKIFYAGQREPVCVQAAAARPRHPGHPDHPLAAAPAPGQGQGRTPVRDSAGTVPGRDDRRRRHRRAGRHRARVSRSA